MAAYPDDLSDSWRRTVRSVLLRWYRRHARRLPWRESADPYRVWISEIMLQQTTIAAATPYFERFCRRFPDVDRLANAPEHEVLRLWEGLGYYSRARNLHRAARIIVDRHAGRFPRSVAELEALPGIGPYTARAVASFAFGRSVGILETNTQRLYARLVELTEPVSASASRRLLWNFADWVVSPRQPGRFNQAAMDIGSTICVPRSPDCSVCPLKTHCSAFRNGRQHELPIVADRPRTTAVTELALVIQRGPRVLMRQIADGERWAGLWDFVRFPVSKDQGDRLQRLPSAGDQRDPESGDTVCRDAQELAGTLAAEHTGLQVQAPRLLKCIRHSVTRYRIRLVAVAASNRTGRPASGFTWKTLTDLDTLPLSTTARQIACMLDHSSR